MAVDLQPKQIQINKRSIWLAVMALLVLLSGGWFVFSRPTDESAGTGTPVEVIANSLPARPAAGHPAPEFTLNTLDGQEIALSSLQGRPVIINFWASWCGPCRLEMPHLQQAHMAQTDDGLVVLGVNLTRRENRLEDISASMEEFGITFPVVLDEDGEVAKLYEVRGQPASVFVDRDGIVQMVFYGPVNEDFINERVDELLGVGQT